MLFDTRADWETYYRIPAEKWGKSPTQTPIYTHYNNFVIGEGQRLRGEWIASLLNLAGGSNVALIGAGFGWTAEGMASVGVNAVGTDISPWIIDNLGTDEEADLRDFIIRAGRDPDNDWVICAPDHPDAVWREDPNKRVAQTGEFEPGQFEWMCHPLELVHIRPGPRSAATVLDEDLSTNGSRKKLEQALGSIDVVITEELLNSVDDAEALVICDLASLLDKPVFHVLSPPQPGASPDLNWKSYSEWRRFLTDNGFDTHGIIPSVTDGAVWQYEVVL